jgi:hypothetical protein
MPPAISFSSWFSRRGCARWGVHLSRVRGLFKAEGKRLKAEEIRMATGHSIAAAAAMLCVAAAVSGCTPIGMNFYKPMTFQKADGTTGVKSVKVASFAADFVGLKRFSMNFQTGDCTIEFQEKLLIHEQYAVLNKKGDLVGTLTRDVAPGIYVAKVIEAYGEAGQKIIKAGAAGVSGAILSAAGPVSLGNGLSALAIKP